MRDLLTRTRRETETEVVVEPAGAPCGAAAKPEFVRFMKVVVVEEDPIVQGVLRGMGIRELCTGSTWESVQDAVSSGWADLLVLDLLLPDHLGSSVLKDLRDHVAGDSYFPVLVLTADGSLETRESALKAGARDFVTKPVAPWELELRISNLLAARHYSQRMRRQYERLEILLELQREIVAKPSDSVYQQVLEAAVRIVPGADAGSVLTHDGKGFAFRAAVGYELDRLRDVRFTPEDMCSWHGGGPQEWQEARPRIMRHDQVDLFDAAAAEELSPDLAEHGRLGEIRANLYLPVVYRDEILAVLNLDNVTDAMAFDQASIEAARIFGPPVASLLHEADHREELRQASLTDPLTGLRNRRGFDEAMCSEQARVDRHGGSFGVLLMDLDGFKKVNDRLGHAAGDELLVELSLALDENRRQEDVIARWGGDEFAVVMPRMTMSSSADAARRYARVVAGIERCGVVLGATVGVSVFPDDGQDQDALLRAADRRLYGARAVGLPFLEHLE